jgi:hypothetical protein
LVALERGDRIGADPHHAVDASQAVEWPLPLLDIAVSLELAVEPRLALESQEDALADLPLIVDVARDQPPFGPLRLSNALNRRCSKWPPIRPAWRS